MLSRLQKVCTQAAYQRQGLGDVSLYEIPEESLSFIHHDACLLGAIDLFRYQILHVAVL